MNEFDERLARLGPEKRELFRARMEALERSQREINMIPRRSDRAELMLSFSQERIWLHEQLVLHSVVYNRATNIHLLGPVDFELLRQALDQVVARHESLRTTVRSAHGTPLLRVQPTVSLQMRFTDLSGESVTAHRD
jgi:hypothetical protein